MQPLAQRVAGDQCLEFCDDVAVAAELQVGVDSLLEADEPELLEMRSLDNREGLVELGQRRTAPQAQSFA